MGLFDNGIGGFISGILGSTNNAGAGSQQGAPEVDPNAYRYGGEPGGAAAHAGAYGNTAGAAQNRTGPQIDNAQSAWDREQGRQARIGQQRVADQIAARAAGQSPQIATMMANRQRDQAAAQQAGLAASARGPAGLALAGQQAANNTANAQGAISGQEQINAANEQRADEAGALGAYGNMRQGDQSAQNLNQQNAQMQAQLEAHQRQLNDARSATYSGLENQVNTTQLQASAQGQAQQSANKLNAAGINAGVGGQNAGMNQQNGMGAIGLGTSIAVGGGTGSGTPPPKVGQARHGGPVPAHHPYLVGEEGPELVVPRAGGGAVAGAYRGHGDTNPYVVGVNGPEIRTFPQDGTVIPAPQTAAMLAPRTWGTGAGMSEPNLQAAQAANVNAANQMQTDDNARLAMGSPQAFTNPVTLQRERDTDMTATLASKRAHDIDITPDEEREERVIKYRSGQDKKEAAAKKTEELKGAPPKSSVASVLTDFGHSMTDKASKVDTSYHGPSSLINPGAIQIGARAMGGPIVGGGTSTAMPAMLLREAPIDYMGGAGGVDIGSGAGGISRGQVLAASTGLGNVPMRGMVGGGGLVGGTNVPGYTAREDGGPVGPSYETSLSPEEEQQFAAWRSKNVSPNDSGGDYDFRGAYKAGAQPGPDGHWVDTFKKPNHETFSDESQYAVGDDAARAGHWDGDTYVAAKPIGAPPAKKAAVDSVARPAKPPAMAAPPSRLKSIAKDAYESMMVGYPATVAADFAADALANKSGPEKNIALMDEGAKLALGPVTGRALIQASTMSPEEQAKEAAARRKAEEEKRLATRTNKPTSANIGAFLSHILAGR